MQTRRSLAALPCLALALFSSSARAESRAYELQLEGGYALARADGQLFHGGAAGARFYVGLTDFVLIGGAARFDGETNGGTLARFFVGGSLEGRLDILKWVPFVSLDVGLVYASWLSGPAPGGADLEVGLGVGVDYLLRRGLSVGGALRYHLHATESSRYPATLSATFRVAWRWE